MASVVAEPVLCPNCGQPLVARGQLGAVPHHWDELVYRCETCGFGFSNAMDPRQRRVIVRYPEMNVPVRVRNGLEDALGRAVNTRNRRTKWWKCCSSRSEDALTWTVARTLEQTGTLEQLIPQKLSESVSGEPSMVLWGVPVGGADAASLAGDLARISKLIGERPAGRSEPDIIVGWSDLLAIVEAKLDSRNEVKPTSYPGWPLYYSETAFRVPADSVARSGLYELVRNWRIGCELAGSRSFVLVNLAPTKLEADVSKLRSVITETPNRHLVTRTWSDALIGAPTEIRDYAKARGAIQ